MFVCLDDPLDLRIREVRQNESLRQVPHKIGLRRAGIRAETLHAPPHSWPVLSTLCPPVCGVQSLVVVVVVVEEGVATKWAYVGCQMKICGLSGAEPFDLNGSQGLLWAPNGRETLIYGP